MTVVELATQVKIYVDTDMKFQFQGNILDVMSHIPTGNGSFVEVADPGQDNRLQNKSMGFSASNFRYIPH